MKKFIKKIICVVFSLMLCLSVVAFSGCEKIKTMNVRLTANGVEYNVEIKLYCHLAPKTCDKIIEYVNDGYYNDALIYRFSSYATQLMVGDLKKVGDNYVQEVKPEIYGEFEKNGTVGSNLVSQKGYVGLWRTWQAADNSSNKYKANTGFNTGRATMFIPTSSISAYNGYFCNFAVIDLENESNLRAIDALSDVFGNEDLYTEYTIYYTGEYDESMADNNYGLTFNIMETEDYNSNVSTDEETGEIRLYEEVDEDVSSETEPEYEVVFNAKNNQLVSFNAQNVKISDNTKIISISVK